MGSPGSFRPRFRSGRPRRTIRRILRANPYAAATCVRLYSVDTQVGGCDRFVYGSGEQEVLTLAFSLAGSVSGRAVFGIDNVSLTTVSVPEPATGACALAAGATMILFCRPRRVGLLNSKLRIRA